LNKSKQLNIGWAQIDITPDRPFLVFGQLYKRVSSYVKDPLTATALVIENGEDQVIMLSLDTVEPVPKIMHEIQKKLSYINGLNPRKITINAIHTHNSYSFGSADLFSVEEIVPKEIQPQIDVPENLMSFEEGNIFLTEKLVAVIENAWNARQPGGISYAIDYAAVAFNRRPVFKDAIGHEESVMYGAASKDEFVRFEGTSDHTVDMLYTWDMKGKLTGIIIDVPCPSQVYELHTFVSADFWYDVRNHVRENLGNIFVLPLCGAAGDQNPLDLVRLSKTNVETLRVWNAQAGEVLRNFDMTAECNDIGERICEAVVRGYRKAKNKIMTDAVLRHSVESVVLPIRLVTEADFEEAQKEVEEYCERFSNENRMNYSDIVRMFEPCGIIDRWKQQNVCTTFSFEIHTIRIGNIAIASNPFELFVDYGMRIKARCKAEQTFVVQLSNDCGGYLPTEAAVNGGSYSSKPASTTCGPEGGDVLVSKTIEAINSLWE
jgi:hypothetical protein